MRNHFHNSLLDIFIFIFSSFFLIGSIFLFLKHLDFFITKKETDGEILNLMESTNGDGMIVTTIYYNSNSDKNDESKIKISYSQAKYYMNTAVRVEIIYSRWFKQTLIKNYKNPRLAIFILDILGMILSFIGFKSCKNIFNGK